MNFKNFDCETWILNFSLDFSVHNFKEWFPPRRSLAADFPQPFGLRILTPTLWPLCPELHVYSRKCVSMIWFEDWRDTHDLHRCAMSASFSRTMMGRSARSVGFRTRRLRDRPPVPTLPCLFYPNFRQAGPKAERLRKDCGKSADCMRISCAMFGVSISFRGICRSMWYFACAVMGTTVKV